jgi:dihydroflavonol-4-reductase
MSGKVLVSGASGYIGSHVINELLTRGYEVVGTVRSLANKEKYAFLYDLPNAKEHLELREADLLDPSSWDSALKGVTNVIHLASPIPLGIPKNDDEFIKPAVEGTRNVIEASLRNKVKRLILTSSVLAIMIRTDGKVGTEDDWSQENLLQHYPKGKYLAEKLFWEEAEKHKEELEFVSIVPTLVTGPAFTKHGNLAEAFVSEILNGGYPGVPTPAYENALVDVRDVAVAHVNALEHADAKGKRYIVAGYDIMNNEIFDLLRSKYGEHYNIPSNPIDAEGIKKSGHLPSMRVLGFLGRKFRLDNSRGIKELGMKYRTAEQSLFDQADRQIELGIVAKK